MDVRQERCGGLDVQKREVVAGLLSSVPDQAGQPRQELRRFGTMTADLERLAIWLEQAGCTHVALESTGSYWQPVWHILEEHGGFTVRLVNPQHIKALGRDKTDVKLRHEVVSVAVEPE